MGKDLYPPEVGIQSRKGLEQRPTSLANRERRHKETYLHPQRDVHSKEEEENLLAQFQQVLSIRNLHHTSPSL